MATCPECDAELVVDADDLDDLEIGDPWDCEACGSRLRVASLDPLEFEGDDDDDEDESDDEEVKDESLGGGDGEQEDEDIDDLDDDDDDDDDEDWEE